MGEEEGAGRERDNGPGQEPFDGVRAVAASSVWPVICVTEVSARLRSLAIRRCSVLGVVLRCTPVGGMITSIPALAISRVMRRPVKALSSRSASLLAASPAARSVPGWRSPMAAGPGDQARTMRVPGSVRMARRKPSNRSAGAPCRRNRAFRSLPGPVRCPAPRTGEGCLTGIAEVSIGWTGSAGAEGAQAARNCSKAPAASGSGG